MGGMELLPMTFASGWASGINAYATVFILGLLGRYAGTGGVPEGFMRTDVLIIMGVLALLELIADKIPVVDSIWDVPSTAIRPIAGAVIGALIAGANGDLLTISLAAVGGVTALLSHLSKAGIRLAVNTSPEPVSNVAASVAGDVGVVSVATLAVLFPVTAAIVAARASREVPWGDPLLARALHVGFGYPRPDPADAARGASRGYPPSDQRHPPRVAHVGPGAAGDWRGRHGVPRRSHPRVGAPVLAGGRVGQRMPDAVCHAFRRAMAGPVSHLAL